MKTPPAWIKKTVQNGKRLLGSKQVENVTQLPIWATPYGKGKVSQRV